MDSLNLSTLLTPLLLEHPKPIGRIPHVFCDMDGVVADFRGTMKRFYGEMTGKELDKFLLEPGAWDRVKKAHPNVFARLAVLPEAPALMSGLSRLRDQGFIQLSMLTAMPSPWHKDPIQREQVTQDKKQWMAKHFPDVTNLNVIVCLRQEKMGFALKELKANMLPPVLIDDFKRNIKEWTRAKGVGILHVRAQETLHELHMYVRAVVEEA